MTTTPHTRHRDDDRGSVAVFFVLAVTAVALMVGLAVDYSGMIKARGHAYLIAGEAARTGGQQVDLTAAQTGTSMAVDPGPAIAAATDYLTAAGTTGTATVDAGGEVLIVTTSETYEPRFLGAFGVGPLTVDGHGQARLARVVEGAEQ